MTKARFNETIFAIMSRQVFVFLLLAGIFSGLLRAAEQPAIEVKSQHFTVVTDTSDKQARHLLDNFERMRWMFQTLFPKTNVDPPSPIVVLAMKNRKSFQTLEPEDYLSKGQVNLAGYFLKTQDKNYVLLRMDAEGEHPFATVFHEYTHLQFSSALEWMPLWLNEGIAEFFQNTDFRDKDVLLGQPSIDDIRYLRENRTIPLDTLFRVDHNSPYYHQENKASVFYAESWALTHYLQVRDREKGTNQVHDYMVLTSQHQDPVTAAEKAFGDLKQLQAALDGYIRQQQYKQFTLSSAAAPLDPASYKGAILKPSDYEARRADLLASVGRKKEARALLDTILASDTTNAQARETMGYLAMLDGDQAAARTWYEEAVKLDSQSYLAHYYFAALAVRQGVTVPNDAIERSLRAAIRLNPAYAPSYDMLSVYYAMLRVKLEEAQALNLKAVQLDRGNFGYRMNAENLLMMRGRYDDAEKVLHLATTLAKTPEDRARVQSSLDQVAQMKKVPASATRIIDASSSGGNSSGETVQIARVEAPPKHPTEPVNGPRHEILGVLAKVECSDPAVMEIHVASSTKGTSKQVLLYTNDYYKLDLTALGFTPKDEMNPCKEIEGMKARVQYADSTDKTVDGQMISIELRK